MAVGKDYEDEDTILTEASSDSAETAATVPETPPTDRFRRGSMLGRGGTAEVVEAQDVTLERIVAIKSLQSRYNNRQEMRLRFLHEAHIMASLDHPGSVPIYELGHKDGEIFYAMKRVQGETLRKILRGYKNQGAREQADIVRFIDIFERVCDTVAFAHDQGIIHRDLKPENVMIDLHGSVYVMDWGLAKRLGDDGQGYQTRSGVLVGTPAYMSPEQARGQGKLAEYTADVFALGTLLYEMMTGHRPFGGTSTREILEGVLYEEPKRPRKLNPHVPRALAAIAMKALSKDPEQRYATAREMLADLRRFREYRPVEAMPFNARDRIAYWARRHPRWATGAISLAVFIVLAFSLLAYRFYLDRVFEEDAAQRLTETQGEVRSLSLLIDDLRRNSSGDPVRERQIETLFLERDLKQEAANQVLAAFLGRSNRRPDPYLLEQARTSMMATIQFDLEAERYNAVLTRVTLLLDQISLENLLQYTPAQIQELEEIRQEAEEKIDAESRRLAAERVALER